MKASLYTVIQCGKSLDTSKNKLFINKKLSTKQKARINVCLERINELVFECYDQPEKVYKLSDVYKVVIKIMQDNNLNDIDLALNIFEARLK